ncbi:MAG: hypothetical protein AMJ42_01255 [Deltaproteobacteria bacterium DG_8]|nr:MAG: hypothetical protein AMJ42_01255 [Deltaproteobacteria bacterium DG_8]
MFIGITLVSSLLLTSVAMAWRGGMKRGMRGWGCGFGPGTCLSSGISNLTSEQSAKLTKLQKNFIQETSKLRSDLTVHRIELNQLLAQPHPNTEEVMAKQKEFTNLKSQLQQKCLGKQLEMRKILTEEQLSQLRYGFDPNANRFINQSPGWMRGYGPPQGQGFGLDRGGVWSKRRGWRPWWQ